MVPLAWALRTAGHDVTFLAGFDGVEVRNAGIPVVEAISSDVSMEDHFPDVAAEAPDIFESMSHLSIEEILALKPMVIQPWDRYVDDYVEAAKQQRPDLIVCDPVFSAGAIAAAVLDIPAISHGYMLLRFTPEFLREHAAPAFERHGVDLPRKIRMLEIGPPSLMESGPAAWQTRYIPYNGGSILPSWLTDPIEGPRITVTLGTPLPHRKDTGRFDRIIEAAREVGAEFALTVNAETGARLGPLPDNVRVTGWVPLFNLLRTSTAVIHHGGSGTMFTSFVAGLPQLIIPAGADNDYNARILAEQGCALHTGPQRVDAEAITTLLTDPGMKDAAAKIAHEIERTPTPADLVDEITEFARS